MKLRLAVKDLVEFSWLLGDAGMSDLDSPSHTEGIEGHRKLQESRPAAEYEPEVYLRHALTSDSGELELELIGRADGVWKKSDGTVAIEEIKTTYQPPLLLVAEDYPHHRAQARIYAAIYATHNGLDQMGIQTTYLDLKSGGSRSFHESWTTEQLLEFLQETAEVYFAWCARTIAWRKERNQRLHTARFPFQKMRPGQQKLITATGNALSQGQALLAEAPTGIGKTMATLFGALQSMKESLDGPMFYLTARGTGAHAVRDALGLLNTQDLEIKYLELSAQTRICPEHESTCARNTRGTLDQVRVRFQGAMLHLWNDSTITADRVATVAADHDVCPYLLGMSLVPFVDVVVGDVNYVFNPRVNGRVVTPFGFGRRSYLVDEAHNLVDRARDFLSAAIDSDLLENAALNCRDKRVKNKILALRQILGHCAPPRDGTTLLPGPPEGIVAVLKELCELLGNPVLYQVEGADVEPLKNLLFEGAYFLKIAGNYDEEYYRTYATTSSEGALLRLFCVDPSDGLMTNIGPGAPVVFFSATLTPNSYYASLLCGPRESRQLTLESPFDPNHLAVCTALISTRFKDRERTADKVADIIASTVRAHKGKYLVFFPSYAYLRLVSDRLEHSAPDLPLSFQDRRMNETERRAFLKPFLEESDDSLVGLGVLGGIFSESIDLAGKSLIGTIIVSVGLPQIGTTSNIIRDHFDQRLGSGRGYDYAYRYPGFTKALQAAGRVIRHEDDRGVVVLIDDRYSESFYRQLRPPHWKMTCETSEKSTIERRLVEFWCSDAFTS